MYSDHQGSSECTTCGCGHEVNAAQDSCQICVSGQYSRNGERCQPCPPNSSQLLLVHANVQFVQLVAKQMDSKLVVICVNQVNSPQLKLNAKIVQMVPSPHNEVQPPVNDVVVVIKLIQHTLLVFSVLQACFRLKDQIVKLVQTIPIHQIQELVHAHHADLVQKSIQLKRVVKYVNQDSSHRIMTCVRDAHQEASQQFKEQPNAIHANVVTESTLIKTVVTFVWLVGSRMADQLVNDVPITHIQQMTEHVNV